MITYEKFMKAFKEEKWPGVVDRYYHWARIAYDFGYNPQAYATKFREDYRKEYASFPEAIKAFDEIDKEIQNG